MFSDNPYPMWIYDCEKLRFLEVNDAALRTYGYSRDEFLAYDANGHPAARRHRCVPTHCPRTS